MLILSRKIGEKIIINGNIEIMITEIDRNKVRLGITAPQEVSINRAEVHERLKGEESNANRT